MIVSPQSIPTASPTLSAGPKAMRLRSLIFVTAPSFIDARKTNSLLSGRLGIISRIEAESSSTATFSSSAERFHAFS